MSTLKIETREQFEAWLKEQSFLTSTAYREHQSISLNDVRALYDALRPRWRPVSERLPKPLQDVAIMQVGGVVMTGFYSDASHQWLIGCDAKGRYTNGVTHWMPLPPLPEES